MNSHHTYTYRRLVRYGDCDASRNYYTPRAIDYAVEAVAGWYEDVLGISWMELTARYDWQVNVVRVGCEFSKTLTAGEVVQARVAVVGLDESRVSFRVSAENETGSVCFLATLTANLIERRNFEPLPMPPDFRERIEMHRVACAQVEAAVKDAGTQAELLHPSPSCAAVAGSCDIPFILERRVTYGECGVSGTVYPPRVFDYLLDAAGEWYQRTLGISWLEQNAARRGQPFLSASCDYLRPMLPGQRISTSVTVSRLGRSSIVYSLVGFDQEGTRYFEAQMAACYVINENGALKPTPFPAQLRERIAAYQAACAALDGTRHK